MSFALPESPMIFPKDEEAFFFLEIGDWILGRQMKICPPQTRKWNGSPQKKAMGAQLHVGIFPPWEHPEKDLVPMYQDMYTLPFLLKDTASELNRSSCADP